MCIVCLGYLSYLPTSALASVLCTCISMYIICSSHQIFLHVCTCTLQLQSLYNAASFLHILRVSVGDEYTVTPPQQMINKATMMSEGADIHVHVHVHVCIMFIEMCMQHHRYYK